MGDHVDNKTSATNRRKMKGRFSVVDAVALDLQPKHYSREQRRKSQAQARNDGAIQAKMVAEREARMANG